MTPEWLFYESFFINEIVHAKRPPKNTKDWIYGPDSTGTSDGIDGNKKDC